MLTGLEIASIVIGCVNATLAAVKLLQDHSKKRQDRKKAEASKKVAESLASDASTIEASYNKYRALVPAKHRNKFENGDEISRSEIEPHSRKIKDMMGALQKSIRSSTSKTSSKNSGLQLHKYLAASAEAHRTIIQALARLHQRVMHALHVPKSLKLNPFKSLFKGTSIESKKAATRSGSSVSLPQSASRRPPSDRSESSTDNNAMALARPDPRTPSSRPPASRSQLSHHTSSQPPAALHCMPSHCPQSHCSCACAARNQTVLPGFDPALLQHVKLSKKTHKSAGTKQKPQMYLVRTARTAYAIDAVDPGRWPNVFNVTTVSATNNDTLVIM